MSRTTARSIAVALAAAVLVAAAPPVSAQEEGGYRMTTYIVGFLYRGPAWTGEHSPELDRLQQEHLAHIGKMAESGKLILAGPFMDDTDLRGLFVFKLDGDSPEAMMAEAERMAAEDPMVRIGHLRLEFKPWYSAEGIGLDQKPAK